MKTRIEKLYEFLEKFCMTKDGAISSKIVVGAITYFMLVISAIVMMFVHPEFPGLQETPLYPPSLAGFLRKRAGEIY